MLIGHKRANANKMVDSARGQALADEYGMRFFEASAKDDINVKEAFYAITHDIKKRLFESPASTAPSNAASAYANVQAWVILVFRLYPSFL